jgi:hypothetical protein
VIAQPIDYVLIIWFVLAGLSTAYVAYDQFTNNPEPTVMKWELVLVTLYMGPLGLQLYVMADKKPRPGTHQVTAYPPASDAQCAISSGRCVDRSTDLVVPPSTISRRREWP